MELTNSVVLITGGSSGIGRAIAKTLVDAGAKVVVTGRNRERLLEVEKELGVTAIEADVSKEADVERTFAQVIEQFGHIDVLVNNAGIGVFHQLVDQDLASFEAVMATNVTGAMLMGRAAAKHFIERNKGNIINIASTAAVRGAPRGTAYYASKFALRGMTECWRAELRKFNVRVILVNPSEVITNFLDAAGLTQNANETKMLPEDIAQAVRSALEMNDRAFTTEVTVFATNPRD